MGLNKQSHIESCAPMYEIRVEGRLSEEWSPWFEGMAIRYETDPEHGSGITVISGRILDQPALHGILNKIRDLNLKLISVLSIDA